MLLYLLSIHKLFVNHFSFVLCIGHKLLKDWTLGENNCATGDKGPIVDCSEKMSLEGCDNGECFGACVYNVKGAVAGTCLPGNHTCECNIPCS